MFRRDEIIMLLGAGASVEAGIPASLEMVRKVEALVSTEWDSHARLYNYVKSAINYSDGIKGQFSTSNCNIERLVNTLDELTKGEEHALYPFVGSWNPKLSEFSASSFDLVRQFRNSILEKLRNEWVHLRNQNDSEYYCGLLDLQQEYQHPLRVFSLNYDLCLETVCRGSNGILQRGFDEDRRWNWRLFEDAEQEPNIYLYKLHGSIDWGYEDGILTDYDQASMIAIDSLAIIFGTSYKLQYLDPFLFFAYEFRKWLLDSARVVVAVGYGFEDEHINGIIGQALRDDPERRLLSVAPLSATSKQSEMIATVLGVSEDQIVRVESGARDFMTNELTIDALTGYFPEVEPNLLNEEVLQTVNNEP